jgi:phosphoglycerol transferase MdoB-like AlkP superfamily enzyme
MVAGAAPTQVATRQWGPLGNLGDLGRALGAYLVLPNLIFVVAGAFVFVARPTFNADYLVLGCAAPFLSRRNVAIAFAILLGNDCLVSLAPVFHFDLSTGAVPVAWSLTSRLLFYPLTIAMAIAIVLVAVVAERFSRTSGKRSERVALIIATTLVIFLDVIAGTNSVQRTDGGVFGFNIATSTLYRTALGLYRAVSTSDSATSAAITPIPSATGTLREGMANHAELTASSEQNIVLVVVESFGHFRHAGSDSVLLQPLLDPAIRARYEVRAGVVPAHGATTSGEIRELCGVRGDFLFIRRMSTTDCLPGILGRAGYRTTAFHGYSRGLYDRMTWYPRVGFQELWFGEDLARIPNTQRCGTTFHGVCDDDVSHVIEQQLVSPGAGERHFIYWLTLDSHLPVDATNVPISILACERLPETQRFGDVCDLVRLHQRVLSTVARWAVHQHLPPTRFIVVGDHAPPFFSRDKRALFAPDEVPFVELIPKGAMTRRPPLAPARRSSGRPVRSASGH